MEAVFKAHLRTKAENIDGFVKTQAREMLLQQEISTHAVLFRAMLSQQVDLSLISGKLEPVNIITILQNWIKWIGREVQQSVSISDTVLNAAVWKRFITRMSLCPWLIEKPKDRSAEHGLELLALFMECCNDVVYGFFTMETTPAVPLNPPVRNSVTLPSAPNAFSEPRFSGPSEMVVRPSGMQAHKFSRSKQFQTLFEDDTTPILPTIQEENAMNEALPPLTTGTLKIPDIQTMGTLVKIRRRNAEPKRETKTKEPKAKKESKMKKRQPRKEESESTSGSDY